MIDQLFGVEMGCVVNDLRKSDYSEDWELAEEITVKQSTLPLHNYKKSPLNIKDWSHVGDSCFFMVRVMAVCLQQLTTQYAFIVPSTSGLLSSLPVSHRCHRLCHRLCRRLHYRLCHRLHYRLCYRLRYRLWHTNIQFIHPPDRMNWASALLL